MSSPFAFAEHDDLPRAARRALVAGVFALHVGAAWMLLQGPGVREAVAEAEPMRVEWLVATPPAPTPPEVAPPPSPPPKPVARPVAPTSARPIARPPVVAAPPAPAAPTEFAVPAEPAMPVHPAPSAAPAPAADEPAPAPPSPAPAAPPSPFSTPRSIPPTAVQYLVPPAPVYPAPARRLGESGRVLVRVEIDTAGRARQLLLLRSSGSPRLDEAALAAVRAARFRPHTDNGEPLAVWTTVPIVFELES